MRLSCAAGYALGALGLLARRETHLSAAMIASDTGAPRKFVAATLTRLAKAGLVRSVRGFGGGYELARAASSITLADIVEAVDGPMHGDGPEMPGALGRRAMAAWRKCAGQARETAKAYVLSDLAAA